MVDVFAWTFQSLNALIHQLQEFIWVGQPTAEVVNAAAAVVVNVGVAIAAAIEDIMAVVVIVVAAAEVVMAVALHLLIIGADLVGIIDHAVVLIHLVVTK